MKRYIIIGAAAVVVLVGVLWFVLRKDLSDHIIIPYIEHQKPRIDPQLPHAVALSDKLDEVLFDGLFNISANPSGVVYEDALGELIDIDTDDNIVTIRLHPKKKWHSSFNVKLDGDDVEVTPATDVFFTAQDLRFTLRRIQELGSLSPDYILVSQALASWEFDGPDNNNEIRFHFKGDRIWTEDDVKEVLSFKIIPQNSPMEAENYYIGTGPYLAATRTGTVTHFYKNPAGEANLHHVILKPFIDNSTFTTELKNGNINVLLSTPFGSLSPILQDSSDFFYKSNISTTFFAILLNTQRLNRDQRREVRRLINNKTIVNRFFKVNSPQQRHIVDYKGNRDNYDDYLNYSVFPSSSYYVDEEIVVPVKDNTPPDLSILPDSLKIVACLNYGHREEYAELIEILNDGSLTKNRIKALAVSNEEIKKGDYDGLLIAIDGYKSTFLFDLYNIFMREPDLAVFRINLKTELDNKGNKVISPATWNGKNNFCRLDATSGDEDVVKFMQYIYAFMYSNYLGDKQVYAGFVADQEQELALGVWLFSLPSLAYFRTQFDANSIDLYGVASQLSTIEKWQERED